MSKYTPAQNKANQRYQKKTYEQITIKVKKGKREEYNATAAAAGESLAGLIVRLLEEEGQRQKEKAAQKEKI